MCLSGILVGVCYLSLTLLCRRSRTRCVTVYLPNNTESMPFALFSADYIDNVLFHFAGKYVSEAVVSSG